MENVLPRSQFRSIDAIISVGCLAESRRSARKSIHAGHPMRNIFSKNSTQNSGDMFRFKSWRLRKEIAYEIHVGRHGSHKMGA